MGNIQSISNHEGKELYVPIWQSIKDDIILCLASSDSPTSILQLNESDFTRVGNRIVSGYRFNLNIYEGKKPSTASTAVGRDLLKVLFGDKQFSSISKRIPHISLKLTPSFQLIISKI